MSSIFDYLLKVYTIKPRDSFYLFIYYTAGTWTLKIIPALKLIQIYNSAQSAEIIIKRVI